MEHPQESAKLQQYLYGDGGWMGGGLWVSWWVGWVVLFFRANEIC